MSTYRKNENSSRNPTHAQATMVGKYHVELRCANPTLDGLPLLDIEEPIGGIVATYISNHVMPNDPAGDALHLAIASFHKCDFLLTWNCRHLANGNKFGHIRLVNTLLGLFVPMLVTPLELLGESS